MGITAIWPSRNAGRCHAIKFNIDESLYDTGLLKELCAMPDREDRFLMSRRAVTGDDCDHAILRRRHSAWMRGSTGLH
jgi:hypothetical protein